MVGMPPDASSVTSRVVLTGRHLAFALIAGAGIGLAGFLRIYEVLMEVAMVTGFLLSASIVLGDGPDGPAGFLPWLRPAFLRDRLLAKRDLIRGLLIGRSPGRAVLQLILYSVLFGCAVALAWLFVKTWQVVIAREIIEIGLDVLIFVPAFFLLRRHMQAYAAAWQQANEEQKRQAEEARRRDADADAALSGDDPDGGYGPVHSPEQKEAYRAAITMAERLEALMHRDEIAALGWNENYWRENRRAELAQEASARWDEARARLFRTRLAALLVFCVLPFAIGYAASFNTAVDAPQALAAAIWGAP